MPNPTFSFKIPADSMANINGVLDTLAKNHPETTLFLTVGINPKLNTATLFFMTEGGKKTRQANAFMSLVRSSQKTDSRGFEGLSSITFHPNITDEDSFREGTSHLYFDNEVKTYIRNIKRRVNPLIGV